MQSIIFDIPSREDFFKGRGTLELGYPWLTFGAIIALENIVNPNLNVLEFGSGGSTLFWSKNCKSVKSFETNKDWFNSVQEKIKNLKNIDLILANDSETKEAIKKEPDNYYDIVLIDSYPKDIQRIELASLAIPKVKLNGFLILDNYLKFGMENFVYPKGWEIYTFDEFKYSGHGTRICRKSC